MRRDVKQVFHGHVVTDGAGVRLRRVFGHHEAGLFDPFLLFDDFRSDDPSNYQQGFSWHPHRGIETITYVLKGNVEHGDSMGNKGVIGAGDVQWMTAGSGIIHMEMPMGDADGAMYGFQLWANLPAAEKMMAPRYQGFTREKIPEAKLDDGTSVKVIAGKFQNVQGPVQDVVIQPEYFDVSLSAGAEFIQPTNKTDTVFIYAYEGSGRSAGTELENPTLLLYGEGDEIAVKAGNEGLKFLFVSGTPLHEPVAWQGSIVMNTEEQLALAYREYAEGTFIKEGKFIK